MRREKMRERIREEKRRGGRHGHGQDFELLRFWRDYDAAVKVDWGRLAAKR